MGTKVFFRHQESLLAFKSKRVKFLALLQSIVRSFVVLPLKLEDFHAVDADNHSVHIPVDRQLVVSNFKGR